MAKIVKSLQVSWSWTGDKYSLRGFNVAVTPTAKNPKEEVVALVYVETSISNDNTYSYKMSNITLDKDAQYKVWVQAVYDNKDSDWVSTGSATVTDDGSATIIVKTDREIQDIVNMASDSVLTRQEKVGLRREWQEIVYEYLQIIASATAQKMPDSNTVLTNFKTQANALGTYLNGGTAWTISDSNKNTFPAWITDANLSANTTIVGDTYRSKFRMYYDAKVKVLEEIKNYTVDNIQVGAVNRVLGTGEEKTFTFNGSSNNIWSVYTIKEDISNIPVIVAFEYETNNLAYDSDGILRFQSSYTSSTSNTTVFQPTYTLTDIIKAGTNSGTVSFKTTFTNMKSSASFRFRADGVTGSLTIRKVRVVTGDILTGWSLAPEDTLEGINEIKSELDSFETTVNSTFKDGIIEVAEAKAIAQHLKTLESTKVDIVKDYDIVYANTYLTGTAKTNLSSAKTAFDSAHNSLVSTINTVISDGKITTTERDSVDSTFNTYNSVLGTLRQRLQEANDAIAKAITNSAVSDVTVGGENLLTNSDFGNRYTNRSVGWDNTLNGTTLADGWSSYNGGLTSPNTGYHAHLYQKDGEWVARYINEADKRWKAMYGSLPTKSKLQLSPNTEYTFSMDVFAEDAGTVIDGGLYYYLQNGNTQSFHGGKFNFTITPLNQWVRYSWTFNTGNIDNTKDVRFYFYGNSGAVGTFYMRKPQLQKGNKATAWTQSPQDLENAYTIVLTNESQSIPTNSSRVPTSSTTYYTDIQVYKGTTKRTDYTVGTPASANGITTGVVTIQATSDQRVNFTVSTGTALTADGGSFTIPITIDGKTFNKTFSWSCAKQGVTGASGKGVSTITEYYLATTASSGVTTSTSGWTTGIQSMTSTNRYLWNYEVIKYTDNSTTTTTPVIIGVYGSTGATGATGNGISSITNYYLATTAGSGVTTSTSGWTTAVQSMTTTNKYLWNYEIIKYTNNTNYTGTPRIIGVYGATGASGADAYTVLLSNEAYTFPAQSNGNIASAIAITSDIIAYKGATRVSASVGAVTNPSGLTVSASSNGTTSAKLTITASAGTSLADSGTVSIPITVDGKSFTKVFSWSKSKAGATGATGSSAMSVDINATSQIFKSNDGGTTYTPDTIVLTPVFQNCSFSSWQYSTNGGSTWSTVVSGSNGLTLSSNVLTIAKTSALFTSTVTSVVFRVNSNNSNIYDVLTVSKLTDAGDVEIGGRNLLLNSDFSKNAYWATNGNASYTNDGKDGKRAMTVQRSNWDGSAGRTGTASPVTTIKDVIPQGTSFTLSAWVYVDSSITLGDNASSIFFRVWRKDTNALYDVCSLPITQSLPKNTWVKLEHTNKASYESKPYVVNDGTSPQVGIYVSKNGKFRVSNIMLERGNKASDWVSAPEDVSSEIDDKIDSYDDSLTQLAIFNKLTNNGALQGLYMQNNKLYVNASYIKTGEFDADLIKAGSITAKNGRTVFDLDNSRLATYNSNGNPTFTISDGTLNFHDFEASGTGSGTGVFDTTVGSFFVEALTGGDVNGRVGINFDSGLNSAISLGYTANKFGRQAVVDIYGYGNTSSSEGRMDVYGLLTVKNSMSTTGSITTSGAITTSSTIKATGQVTSLSSVRGTTFTQSNYGLPLEIGKYIDMHQSGSANDVDVRLVARDRQGLQIARGDDLSKYIEIGTGRDDRYFYNSTSGRYLAMKDDGRLTYDTFTVPHNWRQNFTPFIYSATGNFTMVEQWGEAVFLGDLVWVRGRVRGSRGGHSGAVNIGGLPVSCIAGYPSLQLAFFGGISTALGSNANDIRCYIEGNASHAILNYTDKSTGGWHTLQCSHLITGNIDISFSATYRWR